MLLVGGLVVVFVTLAIRSLRTKDPALPAATQTRVDQMRTSEVPYHATMDSLAQRTRQATGRSKVAVLRAGVLAVAAEGRGRQADSLAVLAARADSLVSAGARSDSLWHEAYDLRTREVVFLVAVIEAKDSVIAAADTARAVEFARANLAVVRANGLESLSEQLTRDFAHANRCTLVRVLGHAVSCPSRVQVGVGSAVLAAVVVSFVTLRR